MNRTDRLHTIHEALRRAGDRGLTAERLASDLEVSLRTIRRDVTALQEGGALIWAQHGPGGGYRLDPSASLPPVAFSPAQAVAAAIALAVVPPGSPFEVDARAAADKLLDTLGPEARARAEAMTERVWVLHDRPEARPRAAVRRAVERSLAEQVVLRIDYRAADDAESRRAVEPVIVAFSGRRWYLVAHCRRRDDIRWFRFDRIVGARCLTERYDPRPVADVGKPPDGAVPVTR